MHEIEQQLSQLEAYVEQAFSALDLASLSQDVDSLSKQMEQPDFWSNSDKAQQISKRHAGLSKQVEPWTKLQAETADIRDFLALDDSSLQDDIAQRLKAAEAAYQSLKGSLRFSGAHDGSDAAITIQAGAGGTDAQDWTAMLLRMYSRWLDKQEDVSYQIVSETQGEEAGLKSVSITASGPYAYGKLKSEHGVHRLVRLSPFNTANHNLAAGWLLFSGNNFE